MTKLFLEKIKFNKKAFNKIYENFKFDVYIAKHYTTGLVNRQDYAVMGASVNGIGAMQLVDTDTKVSKVCKYVMEMKTLTKQVRMYIF